MTSTHAAVLTPREVEEAIRRNLPTVDHHGEVVEQIGADSILVRLPFRSEFMGTEPWQDGGGLVFSGPMVMAMADTTMYSCVLAAMGTGVIPVMVNIHINFLSPATDRDLLGEARIVRRGKRLHYLECWLTSEGSNEPCAHATSTYRVAVRDKVST